MDYVDSLPSWDKAPSRGRKPYVCRIGHAGVSQGSRMPQLAVQFTPLLPRVTRLRYLLVFFQTWLRVLRGSLATTIPLLPLLSSIPFSLPLRTVERPVSRLVLLLNLRGYTKLVYSAESD
jgi:hypothetical protein